MLEALGQQLPETASKGLRKTASKTQMDLLDVPAFESKKGSREILALQMKHI